MGAAALAGCGKTDLSRPPKILYGRDVCVQCRMIIQDERFASAVITQEGEAKAVIRDIHEYEKEQETLALFRILALGKKQVEEGRKVPAAEAMRRVRARIRNR